MPEKQISIPRIDARSGEWQSEFAALRAKLSPAGDVVSESSRAKTVAVFGEALSPRQVVARICGDVQSQGLPALLDYTQAIDGAKLTGETMRVSVDELAAAHAAADAGFLASVRAIGDRVHAFQAAILHREARLAGAGGSYLAERYVPLRRVGVCVPGGAAAYPSTVLMTAVPAQAAGVQELAVVAPPTPNGAYNVDLLATCYEIGVHEVYRVGGAQAVAALAYGVEGMPAVDKIVGPGNLFVALAKQHVFGQVDIDSIAGPSEVVVIADASARADFVAADLIAQAEHSPGASILITWDEELVSAVAAEVQNQLQTLDRAELAADALAEFGAMVLASNADQAVALTNEIAPEHLHIQTSDAEALSLRTTTAGAVFVGPYSPVAAGDYAAGPSHVLPTSGTARWASGLTANDFLRSHSVISLSHGELAEIATHIERIARKEGLTGHWESVAVRTREERRP